MQTLKTALLVVFMLIAIYGAYMIISKPPVKPPEEVSQLTEDDLKAPDIGIGKTVSPDELVFGSASDIDNSSTGSTNSENGDNEFDPDAIESAINIDIDGLNDSNSETPKNENSQSENPNTESATDNATEQSTTSPSNDQDSSPGTISLENVEGAALVNPPENNNTALITDKPEDFTTPSEENATKTPLIITPEQKPGVFADGPSQVNPASVTEPESSQQFSSPAERSFEKAWVSAVKQAEQQNFRESLLTLSVFFDDPNLSQANQSKLLRQLDLLAAHVIYSRRSLLEPAFVVRPGDTIHSIAKQYRVPAALLQNINGISAGNPLLPGTELKVVRGPFRASVSLAKNEMTLFLGHLYAGRFPISIGSNPAPRTGSYQVQLKQPGRPFYNESQQPIPAGDPNNPYGNIWIDLGSNMSIHGSPRTAANSNQGQSCIGLTETHARDIYGILTEGSQVIIRR